MLQGQQGGRKGASLNFPALFFGFMKNLNTHTKMAEQSCLQRAGGKWQTARCTLNVAYNNNNKATLQALHEPPGKGAAQIARQTPARGVCGQWDKNDSQAGRTMGQAGQPTKRGGQGIELGQAGGEFATCLRRPCSANNVGQSMRGSNTKQTRHEQLSPLRQIRRGQFAVLLSRAPPQEVCLTPSPPACHTLLS